MSDINSVTLVGRLTEKPVLRYTRTGTPVTTLRIANNTFIKRADGGIEPKANFFNVTVWGKSAENCSRYLDKGRQVAIQGRLEYRVWHTQSGEKRNTVEIIARRVQFIGGPRDIAEVPSPEATPAPAEPEAVEDVVPEEALEESAEKSEVVEDFNEPLDDDEIPF